ncbi:MAG: HAD hydrolase family protein [Candidatus Omnitrophica bacterium]|nr:HAD hydrolase family protein [Candidatus Omnitrophota bacterium]
MKKDIEKLFQKIKLLVLDVDGVLTKGEIIYSDKGREIKIFNVKDGLGVFLLGRMGIKTVILTAKDGGIVRHRAKDMKVAEVIGGILPKEKMLPYITKKYKVKKDQVCFIADDVIDIGVLKEVGLGVAVADAASAAKRAANYITKKKGGEGAVREVIDLIFKIQKMDKKLSQWLKRPNWD